MDAHSRDRLATQAVRVAVGAVLGAGVGALLGYGLSSPHFLARGPLQQLTPGEWMAPWVIAGALVGAWLCRLGGRAP